ncbi:MAG: hypothetical protein ACKOXK_02325 [Chakrabartia sp.]
MAGLSRYAGLSGNMARAVMAALALLMLASLWPATHIPPEKVLIVNGKPAERDADLRLYEAITRRIAAGESYYVAAADEQRHRSYPLKPFVTVRLPTLAFVSAKISPWALHGLVLTLAAAVVLAWRRRLRGELPMPAQEIAAALLLIPGMTLINTGYYLTVHEIWAGLLIALSLALYRPQQWGLAWLAAAAAVAVRELAVPYILLMAAFALYNRQWREFAAWVGLILLLAIGLYAHMQALAAVLRPGDPASGPWTVMGGPGAALSFIHLTAGLRGVSPLIGYPFILLCLFGWLGWRSETGLRVVLLMAGYGLLFMLTGRDVNFYWGLLLAPLLMPGLAFLRPAFGDLLAAMRKPKLDLARD